MGIGVESFRVGRILRRAGDGDRIVVPIVVPFDFRIDLPLFRREHPARDHSALLLIDELVLDEFLAADRQPLGRTGGERGGGSVRGQREGQRNNQDGSVGSHRWIPVSYAS